ncbi:MAG: hypothetical protein ACKVJG_00525 [Candidatus Latescibacterota bacterium]|jgi:hypothetical protein
MSNVKEAIEEIIEESYLLGLSEDEIRQDFKRFIDTCFNVIQSHVKNREAISGLTEDLTREKTCILIADHAGEGDSEVNAAGEGDLADGMQEAFAEKVARRKRLILKAIADYDPHLVRLIDEQRFQGDVKMERKLRIKKPRDWEQHRILFLKLGYATTVVLITLLIYLGFIQTP